MSINGIFVLANVIWLSGSMDTAIGQDSRSLLLWLGGVAPSKVDISFFHKRRHFPRATPVGRLVLEVSSVCLIAFSDDTSSSILSWLPGSLLPIHLNTREILSSRATAAISTLVPPWFLPSELHKPATGVHEQERGLRPTFWTSRLRATRPGRMHHTDSRSTL